MKYKLLTLTSLLILAFSGLTACGTMPAENNSGTANTGNTVTNNGPATCNGFGGSVQDNALVTYGCVDPAGALYEMTFDGNGGFVWYFITTGDLPIVNGQYQIVGEQVRLIIPGFDVNRADFDETSNRTVVKLGMLAGFETNRLSCGAIRHEFDQPDLAEADYRCDPYSAGPSVSHHPVIRLGGIDATPNSPVFNQNQPGNAFWSTQKDIAGSIVNEDYNGIYRQVGTTICMYFPGAPSDRQELSATISDDRSTLNVDRRELNQNGPCDRI